MFEDNPAIDCICPSCKKPTKMTKEQIAMGLQCYDCCLDDTFGPPTIVIINRKSSIIVTPQRN